MWMIHDEEEISDVLPLFQVAFVRAVKTLAKFGRVRTKTEDEWNTPSEG